MAAEQIGLVAVFDLRKFNKSYSQYIRKLNSLNTTTTGTAKKLTQSFVGFGNQLLKIGAILTGVIAAGAAIAGAALVGMVTDAVSKAADLEQGVANIASVLNMTTDEASVLKDVIIDLGIDPRLKVTTFEAADALEKLAKNGIFAGMSVAEMKEVALDAGTAVVMLANATGADFAQAANISSTAMEIFNLEASDMVDIVSNITGVTTNSKFTIQDYEVALRNGGAAVAAFGLGLEDFNTMVALSAEEMGTGQKAGTGLLNFMNRLTPNTKKAEQAMKDLGLVTEDGTNLFFDATGEIKDMAEVSRLLNQAMFGTNKIVSEVGGRTYEQNILLQDLNAEYKAAEQQIYDYTEGVDGLLASEDERNSKIAEAQDIMAKLSPEIDSLNAIQGDYITTLQQLSTEQRMVALETIFGNDAIRTALAVSKEGQQVVTDYTAVMRAFGVDAGEAWTMIADGLTEYELLQQEIANTDAIDNATTRMDTFRGSIDKIQGVVEGLAIKFGDNLLPVITQVTEGLLEWWEQNQDTLIPFLENLGEAVGTFAQAIIDGENPIQSFSDLLGQIGGDELAGKFDNVVQSIQDFITPIAEFVTEHSAEFTSALQGIGIALAGFAGLAVVAGILNMILNPIAWIIAGVALLKVAWDQNFGGIQEKTEAFITSLEPLREAVSQIFEAFKKGGAKGGFGEIVSQIQGGLAPALETLNEKLGPVIGFFKAFFTTIAENYQGTFVNFKDALQEFIPVWDQLKDTFDALKPILTVLVSTFAFVIATIWAGITGFLEGAIKPFMQGLALVVDGILKVIEGVADFVVGLVTVIAGALTGNTEMMKEGFSQLMEGIGNIIGGAFEAIVGLVMGALGTIIGGVIGFVTSVIEWFENLYMELVGASIIPDMVNAIIEWFGTLYESVITWITDLVTGAIQWFTDMKDKIIAKIVIFVFVMKNKFEFMFKELKRIVTEKVEEIKKKFQDFIQDIKDFFTETDWTALGQSVMNGLIEGIENKLASAIATVQSVGSSIKSAWDEFWNSHSPSRLMFESGVDIMTGATMGVMEGVSSLVNAMDIAGAGASAGFIESAANILPNSPVSSGGASSVTTTNNYEVNNSFANTPQITDADQLRLSLAGFR